MRQTSCVEERMNSKPGDNASAVRRMEAEFARILRTAVKENKFGQFGVIVSLQSGHVKTYQTHAVETFK